MATPEERNQRPSFLLWRYWVCWVVFVSAAIAIAVVAVLNMGPLRRPDAPLVVIVALLVMLELGPLFRGRWERAQMATLAASLMFIFALLLRWGLVVAIVGQVAAVVVETLLNRKTIWRTLVNIANWVLSLGSAYLVLLAFGQGASLAAPGHITPITLPALVTASLVSFMVNNLIVGTLDSFKYQAPWWAEVRLGIILEPINDLASIALSPLVVLAAERSPWLVPLLLVPLLAYYKSNVAALALAHQANHDALTRLPNRAHLLERASVAFANATERHSTVGLFILDLDRFKEINDTLGHHAGDRLLVVVAERLAAAVRPGDLVARLGGDEFAVLLPDIGDEKTGQAVAARVTDAVRAPLTLDGVLLNVDSSLGIALSPGHGSDFETLMQCADLAMYAAKGRGTSCEIYSSELSAGSAGRLNLLGDLRLALEADAGGESETGGSVALHYQPQVSLAGGRLVGVEALLRWRHPVRGMIAPDEFIAKVEKTALMKLLSQRVVDDAVAQASRWGDRGLSVRVAVNVSVTDLHRPEFAEYVASRLRHHGVDPCWLQFEITEGALMVDPGRALLTLQALKTLGVSLSLDDFGTGYSSMSQLHRLPVTEIKIDRSFISRMDVDVDDRTIVRSMIDLGRALGLRVVAEGVEDQATWTDLAEMGCDDAQGWLITRALPEEEMTDWLIQNGRFGLPLVVAPEIGIA